MHACLSIVFFCTRGTLACIKRLACCSVSSPLLLRSPAALLGQWLVVLKGSRAANIQTQTLTRLRKPSGFLHTPAVRAGPERLAKAWAVREVEKDVRERGKCVCVCMCVCTFLVHYCKVISLHLTCYLLLDSHQLVDAVPTEQQDSSFKWDGHVSPTLPQSFFFVLLPLHCHILYAVC